MLLGSFALLCGIAIYLIWRSQNINIYIWCENIGLGSILSDLRGSLGKIQMGDFFCNSLPDGLYCIAYILISDSIWEKEKRWLRILVSSIIPLMAVIHETLQAFGAVRGTFDTLDLMCYSLPLIIYIFLFLPAGKKSSSIDADLLTN